MKLFICLVLIAICNVAVNKAAAIDVQEESELQIEASHPDAEAYGYVEEHSRHRRQASNGQAGVNVRRQGGTTSANVQVGKVWQSSNGKTQVEVNGNYGRDFGKGGSKPNYGANIGIKHRW